MYATPNDLSNKVFHSMCSTPKHFLDVLDLNNAKKKFINMKNKSLPVTTWIFSLSYAVHTYTMNALCNFSYAVMPIFEYINHKCPQ